MSLILSGTDGLSDVDGTAATPAIRGTDANTGIFFPAADTIAFSEGGVEAMRIDSGGSVRINNTSNATFSAQLNTQFASAFQCGQYLKVTDTSASQSMFIFGNSSSDAVGSIGTSGSTTSYNTSATSGIIGVDASTIAINTASSERMRIDSSGNVGIGTASPGYRLEVKGPAATAGQLSIHDGTGDTVVSGTNAASLLFQCRDSSVRTLAEIDGVHTTTNGTGGAMVFQTRISDVLAERMRIDSSGNLLVGSTSNIAASAKIFAKGSGVGIAVGYGTGNTEYRHLYMNSGDGTLYFFNPTNYASLSSAGAWVNASDARLKKNIVDIKYGLADVLKAQPRSYQMNAVDGDFVGFIAQELQTVIPEVVSGDPEKQLGVDYGSLVAVAFKAIQEQQALITSLTARITALESN